MELKKRTIRWQRIFLLEILVGLLLMTGVLLLSARMDMADAEKRLSTTVEYMKEQCNNSQLRDLASEAKSLLRVTESVEQIRWRLDHSGGPEGTVDAGILEDCARDGYLSGLFLLDAEGDVVSQYSTGETTAESLMSQLDRAALMDVMVFPEKTYAVRLGYEDESHIDVAAVDRADGTGVLVGWYSTSSVYSRTFNNSIRLLVSGYAPEHEGIIAISSGGNIVASNDRTLVGTNVEDTRILRRITEQGLGKKLIHASVDGTVFGHDFGLMDKSQNYYIYAFQHEHAVFAATPRNLLYALFLYLMFLAAAHMVWWNTERIYQRRQSAAQRRYTAMLETKNKELQEAAVKAERANAAKSAFLSNMSHDIRTPLNGIIGLLSISTDHLDDPALVREDHRKMRVSADHLLSLINDVLEMSKLEDGTIVLAHEPICLAELTQDIVSIVVDRAVEAGIEWDYEKGKAVIPYPYIYGSPLHLRQIFLNIYGNCIKYNRPGGRITTIVDVADEGDGTCTYRWTITDTGIGMSEEFLAHIFEPFSQEKNDARSVYQGTGLGMSIVKRLLDKMGGTIAVTSQVGVGSTFTITILFETAPAPGAQPAPDEEGDIRGLRLLLAEDNELNAEIAETLLKDRGAVLTTVTDGRQAVEQFRDSPAGTFDAILMDIMMPEMDGLEAARTIRAMDRPDAKTIPIIAMTANAFAEDAQKCMDAGMDAHMTKPLEIDKVADTIARLCGRTKGRDDRR